MPKYHVNPETGEAGLCRAQTQCPFGDLEKDHYPSPREARKGYEKTMASFIAPEIEKSINTPSYVQPSTIIPNIEKKVYQDKISLTFKELVPGDALPDGRIIKTKRLIPKSPKVEFETTDGTIVTYGRGDLAYDGKIEERTALEGFFQRAEALKEYKMEEAILNNIPKINKLEKLVARKNVGKNIDKYAKELKDLANEKKSYGVKYPYRDAWLNFSRNQLAPKPTFDLGPYVILEPFLNRSDRPDVAAAKTVMKELVEGKKFAHNEMGQTFLAKLKKD